DEKLIALALGETGQALELRILDEPAAVRGVFGLRAKLPDLAIAERSGRDGERGAAAEYGKNTQAQHDVARASSADEARRRRAGGGEGRGGGGGRRGRVGKEHAGSEWGGPGEFSGGGPSWAGWGSRRRTCAASCRRGRLRVPPRPPSSSRPPSAPVPAPARWR